MSFEKLLSRSLRVSPKTSTSTLKVRRRLNPEAQVLTMKEIEDGLRQDKKRIQGKKTTKNTLSLSEHIDRLEEKRKSSEEKSQPQSKKRN